MEDNKTMTKGQKCSAFVIELLAITEESNPNVSFKIFDINNKFIALKTEFKDDDVENTIIKMISSNNVLFKNLNKDKDLCKYVTNYFFNENSNLKEFKTSLSNFVFFCTKGGTEDVFEEHKREQLKRDINKENKVGEIYKSGVLDFYFVRNKLEAKTEFWKVKEAVAWLVCFAENIPYKLTNIIEKQENGLVDKDKTFTNLVNHVNHSSITQNNPFEMLGRTEKKRFGYKFNDAQSGEVDVMMWNPVTRKIVASSATRDRGVEVEGNQFFRHMLKTSITASYVKTYLQSKINKEPKENKRNAEAKYYSAHYVRQMFKDPKGAFIEYIKKDLEKKAELIYENDRSNALFVNSREGSEFSKEVIFHRFLNEKDRTSIQRHFDKEGFPYVAKTDSNFKDDDFNISKEEMIYHIETMNRNVDYVYYGETANNQDNLSLLAGLNSIAYRDNLRVIGKFKIESDAGHLLMDSISKRFNGISHSTKNVEEEAHRRIFDLFVNEENNLKNVDFITRFSKNNVSREERECLFGSFSVLFNTLGDSFENFNSDESVSIKDIKKSLSKGVTKFFASSLKRKDVNLLVDSLINEKDNEKVMTVLENIQGNNSEVSKEFFKMETAFKYFNKAKSDSFTWVEKQEAVALNQELLKEIEELKKQLNPELSPNKKNTVIDNTASLSNNDEEKTKKTRTFRR